MYASSLVVSKESSNYLLTFLIINLAGIKAGYPVKHRGLKLYEVIVPDGPLFQRGLHGSYCIMD